MSPSSDQPGVGGGSGESQRGVLQPLSPLPTPRPRLFAFKEKRTKENSGRVGKRLLTVAIGPYACQSGRRCPTLWPWSPGGRVWGSCPELGVGEPVQEVTGAAAAAGVAVATLSAVAAKVPAPAREAQKTISGLETGPGRVSIARGQEPPPARRPVQSRVLRSGRLERSSKGWAGRHPDRSALPFGTRFEDCPVRARAVSPGRERPLLEAEKRWAGRRAILGHALGLSGEAGMGPHTCCPAVSGGEQPTSTPSGAFVGQELYSFVVAY